MKVFGNQIELGSGLEVDANGAVASKLKVKPGSEGHIVYDPATGEIGVSSIAMVDVHLDNVAPDLASFVVSNYTGTQFQTGDTVILSAATGGSQVYMHNGGTSGTASDFTLLENPDITDDYIRSLISGGNGLTYTPAIGALKLGGVLTEDTNIDSADPLARKNVSFGNIEPLNNFVVNTANDTNFTAAKFVVDSSGEVDVNGFTPNAGRFYVGYNFMPDPKSTAAVGASLKSPLGVWTYMRLQTHFGDIGLVDPLGTVLERSRLHFSLDPGKQSSLALATDQGGGAEAISVNLNSQDPADGTTEFTVFVNGSAGGGGTIRVTPAIVEGISDVVKFDAVNGLFLRTPSVLTAAAANGQVLCLIDSATGKVEFVSFADMVASRTYLEQSTGSTITIINLTSPVSVAPNHISGFAVSVKVNGLEQYYDPTLSAANTYRVNSNTQIELQSRLSSDYVCISYIS